MTEKWLQFCEVLEKAVDECLNDGMPSEITIEARNGTIVKVGVYVEREDLGDIEIGDVDGPILIGGSNVRN